MIQSIKESQRCFDDGERADAFFNNNKNLIELIIARNTVV